MWNLRRERERKKKKKEWLAEAKPKILHKQAPSVKRTLTRMILTISRKGAS
jgi:hypothetical protein